MKTHLLPVCLIACLAAAGAERVCAAPVLPHVYRSGVNLAAQGDTLTRAVTFLSSDNYSFLSATIIPPSPPKKTGSSDFFLFVSFSFFVKSCEFL